MEKRDKRSREGGKSSSTRAKGLRRRFGGSSRRKLTQVRTVNLRTRRSRIPRDATKTVCVLSLRVTLVLSSALTRGYIFRQGGPSMHLKAPTRIFLRLFRVQRHRLRDDGMFAQQMTRPDQKTWIFDKNRARASEYELHESECQALIALATGTQRDLSLIKRNIVEKGE